MTNPSGKFNIKKIREQETQQTSNLVDQQNVKPESQKASEPEMIEEPKERMVNLCAKVPESMRRYWAAQSKLKGRTMTEVIIEALINEFGLPDNQ